MPKRPELVLPDYILERRTRPLDLICGVGISAALILMLAIAAPQGIEPSAIDSLIEQYHRTVALESKVSGYPVRSSAVCDLPA
jgi:hypothetical protein